MLSTMLLSLLPMASVSSGQRVMWAFPTPERITGTDTLVALAKRCAEKGYRMYLLGAAPGIAEQAGERLQALAPGLQIAGTYAGSPSPDEVDAIIERIHAANADILCVAYGAPAQDLWIYAQSFSIYPLQSQWELVEHTISSRDANDARHK